MKVNTQGTQHNSTSGRSNAMEDVDAMPEVHADTMCTLKSMLFSSPLVSGVTPTTASRNIATIISTADAHPLVFSNTEAANGRHFIGTDTRIIIEKISSVQIHLLRWLMKNTVCDSESGILWL
jgi:hypothetical protein